MPAIVIVTTAIISLLAYGRLVRFFISGWQKAQNIIPANCPSNLPFISVVVAFRNEAHNLPALINAIEKQTINHNGFELILVNDDSSDQWESIIPKKTTFKLIVINNLGLGKKQAVRTGVETANGSIILATDADCTPNPNWILSMGQRVTATGAHLLIGPVMLQREAGFFHFFQQADFLSLQLSGAGAALNGRPIMCNGANLAFDRMFYLEVPHLNNNYASGDDMFLLHRAKKLQKTIGYANTFDAIVVTQPQTSPIQLFIQRIRWGAKAKGYTDFDTIAVAIVVTAANFAISSFIVGGIFSPILWAFAATLLIGKGICEFFLFGYSQHLFGVQIAATIFDRRYWTLQLLHPFYTCVVVAAALTTNVSWKNRPTVNQQKTIS
jgi:biofilm PGA synthesis N-glycosyltransferase PgaC